MKRMMPYGITGLERVKGVARMHTVLCTVITI